MNTEEKINPSHYQNLNPLYEVFKVIEAWGLNWHIGSAVKYLARAGKKPGEAAVDDLRKARWYLDRLIAKLIEEGPKLPGGPSAPPKASQKPQEAPICSQKPFEPLKEKTLASEPPNPFPETVLQVTGSSESFLELQGPDGWKYKAPREQSFRIHHDGDDASWFIICTPKPFPKAPDVEAPEAQESPKESPKELSSSLEKERLGGEAQEALSMEKKMVQELSRRYPRAYSMDVQIVQNGKLPKTGTTFMDPKWSDDNQEVS